MKYPIIHERIQKLLNEEDFRDEFSHTSLHDQNVFDEFRAAQTKKKQEEEAKKSAEARAKKEADL